LAAALACVLLGERAGRALQAGKLLVGPGLRPTGARVKESWIVVSLRKFVLLNKQLNLYCVTN
jgi:hypothetical protein